MKGEAHGRHKLTEGDVEYIRRNYSTGHDGPHAISGSARQLALKFNISRRQVMRIVRNENWKKEEP
jgi:hypothetical protein